MVSFFLKLASSTPKIKRTVKLVSIKAGDPFTQVLLNFVLRHFFHVFPVRKVALYRSHYVIGQAGKTPIFSLLQRIEGDLLYISC